MRGNPDGSLSSAGASRAPALFPVYGWGFITDLFLVAALGGSEDKVLAGGTPANPAALARPTG